MQHPPAPSAWRIAFGGMCALIVAMGVGRFAYTPLLPLMQHAYGFGEATAGGIAAVNYAGYLLGALLCMSAAIGARRVAVLRWSLLLSVGTTAAMGLSDTLAAWWALRFVGGLASAGVMVLGSAVALETLAQRGTSQHRGIIFSGVGGGIVLSGAAVLALNGLLDVRGQWLALGALCLPLVAISWRWLLRPAAHHSRRAAAAPASAAAPARVPFLPWLAAAYFSVGLGYIVSGTFLVAIVQENVASSAAGTTTWMLAGLAAAASTLIWPALAARFGTVRALVAAHALQALGIVLPALSPGLVAAYVGALLFGGTFMGIVALTMSLGQRLAPQRSARVLGLLTAAYGSGQIIGPLLAGIIATQTASFTLPLLLAAAVVAAGGALLIVGARHGTHEVARIPEPAISEQQVKGTTDAVR
jgi:predicted MFS family arabinose efflux permease